MPELRKDPITGRWVIISTERGKRPNDFLRESVIPREEKNCPFCVGNESRTPPEILVYGRNGGGPNTPGWSIRVVPNKFPALGIEGELDLVGYDGKTLAFVEVRTRTIREDLPALPELSVTREKQYVVVRTAQRFLAECRVGDCPCRLDVMAIDNCPGQPPVVRLHKDAFSPQM